MRNEKKAAKLTETEYLLKSPAMAKRLLGAIANIKKNKEKVIIKNKGKFKMPKYDVLE